MNKVIKNTLFFFLVLIFFIAPVEAIQSKFVDQKSQKATTIPLRKKIKILSIDGGGIRGLIPALILKNLEDRLKNKYISQCFDIMAGTSTGGLIILMLNVPGPNGRPKYRAREIAKLYKEFGKKVFYKSLWHRFKTLNGWIAAEYSSDNLENFLKHYLAETRLSEAVSNIIIPAYDIENDKTLFFNKINAQEHSNKNFYFRDIGRATSAAPTYFKPAIIKDLSGKERYLIDGGVATNNPALIAYQHAYEIYGPNCDYILVSLGTGTFYGAPQKIIQTNSIIEEGGAWQWMKDNELISIMLYGGSDIIDYRLNHLLNSNSNKRYYRFQSILENVYTATDNTSPENIIALQKYAIKIIEKNDLELEEIAKIIE